MRENPGPDVAVMALRPARDAPITAPMDAISSSNWINTPPSLLGRREAIISMISEDGVMGYPP